MPRRRKQPKVTFEDVPCKRCGTVVTVSRSPEKPKSDLDGVCENCKTEDEKYRHFSPYK